MDSTTLESSLFPISMEKHIIFCIIATILFVLQFVRTKQWYQLVMAAAIPLSLLVYIDEENTTLFNCVGILEAVLLCAALVLNIMQSHKENKADAAKKAAEAAAAEAAETAAASAEEAVETAEEAVEEAAEAVAEEKPEDAE